MIWPLTKKVGLSPVLGYTYDMHATICTEYTADVSFMCMYAWCSWTSQIFKLTISAPLPPPPPPNNSLQLCLEYKQTFLPDRNSCMLSVAIPDPWVYCMHILIRSFLSCEWRPYNLYVGNTQSPRQYIHVQILCSYTCTKYWCIKKNGSMVHIYMNSWIDYH